MKSSVPLFGRLNSDFELQWINDVDVDVDVDADADADADADGDFVCDEEGASITRKVPRSSCACCRTSSS
jgi:hypothetical protein